ncbi:cold-shock protein [Paenibacillus thailandensis]|uniref:Cold-shock protein n=1 Tax=Paenibacillus thailandensis TaxID=393250 RepID=A0ABW5R3B5_9BACL
MYKEANVWEGLQSEEMAEVNALIQPSIAKSRCRGKNEASGPVYQPVSPSKHVGKVVFFNAERGFGMIGTDGIFLHVSNVVDGNAAFLRKNSIVAYEEGVDRRGRTQAVDVQLVAEEAN